jgi:hypothetical protein
MGLTGNPIGDIAAARPEEPGQASRRACLPAVLAGGPVARKARWYGAG